jgi:hypothetical protein
MFAGCSEFIGDKAASHGHLGVPGAVAPLAGANAGYIVMHLRNPSLSPSSARRVVIASRLFDSTACFQFLRSCVIVWSVLERCLFDLYLGEVSKGDHWHPLSPSTRAAVSEAQNTQTCHKRSRVGGRTFGIRTRTASSRSSDSHNPGLLTFWDDLAKCSEITKTKDIIDKPPKYVPKDSTCHTLE